MQFMLNNFSFLKKYLGFFQPELGVPLREVGRGEGVGIYFSNMDGPVV